MRSAAVVAVSCLAVMVSSAVNAGAVRADVDELVPTGKGWGERPAPGPGPGEGAGQGQGQPQGQGKPSRPTSGNGIDYHGGPVMVDSAKGPPNIYYIWYGNWSGNSATTLLTNLAQNIGGSSYLRINTTYYNGAGIHVSGKTNFPSLQNSAQDAYSQGTSFGDAGVQAIVAKAINSQALPLDSNGVYFVLTSADVNETSGFCTQYCGWHTHGTITGTDIKFAFVGNPDRCPSACAEQTTSPNGNTGADGMASIVSHELEEAISDPDLNAWYDRRGQENADKCAWTFGSTTTLKTGAKYNVTLGGTNYLIQQNWVNASGGYCAMSF
ncbi:MAG TPA: hypothetical protein VFO53_00905 [Casimicrobiaceae bacterium]|nr:hypothetical protein [Casimicrobiaceae bacterium]